MCEIVSGWMHKTTFEYITADPMSHSGTQSLLKWDSKEVQKWAEFEWPRDNKKPVMRGGTYEMHRMLMAHFPNRDALVEWAKPLCRKHKIELITTQDEAANCAGLDGWRYICDLGDTVSLPQHTTGDVDASSATSVSLPQHIAGWRSGSAIGS